MRYDSIKCRKTVTTTIVTTTIVATIVATITTTIKPLYHPYQLLERHLYWSGKLVNYGIIVPIISATTTVYSTPHFTFLDSTKLPKYSRQRIQYIMEVLRLEEVSIASLVATDFVVYQNQIHLRTMYWAKKDHLVKAIFHWTKDLTTLHLENYPSNHSLFKELVQTLNIDCPNPPKIIVMVSIANLLAWSDLRLTCLSLLHFYKQHISFIFSLVTDLFSLIELSILKRDIRTTIDSLLITILEIPNKGMDIGGFMCCFQEIMVRTISYDFFIKLHSKSDSGWRKELLTPFNGANIKRTHLELLRDPHTAIIGTDKWTYNLGYWGDTLNKDTIIALSKDCGFSVSEIYKPMSPGLINWKKYAETYNIPYVNKVGNEMYHHYRSTGNYSKYELDFDIPSNPSLWLPKFVAGTIFMGNYAIFFAFFQTHRISNYYSQLEDGYITNTQDTKTHAWERMMGLIAHFNKMRIVNLKKRDS